MPNFRYTLSNAQVDLFCEQHGYQATVPDGSFPPTGATVPNPESKTVFANRKIGEYIVSTIRTGKQRNRQASRIAEDAADAAAIVVATGVIT